MYLSYSDQAEVRKLQGFYSSISICKLQLRRERGGSVDNCGKVLKKTIGLIEQFRTYGLC
jgi:hypothetical protein